MSITYPVDTNARYDIYDTDSQTIVAENIAWPRADGMQVSGMAANLVPLLHLIETPVVDESTQRLGDWLDPVIDLQAATSTHRRAVVDLTLEQAKTQRKFVVQVAFEQALEAGYDTGLGVSLRLGTEDRAAFSQRQQLVDKALELGQMAGTDTTLLSGINDEVLQVEAQQLGPLLLAYGFHYDTLWTRLANARNAINQAATVAEVNQVAF